MSFPGDNLLDYIEGILSGNTSIPASRHPYSEAWAPLEWYSSVDTSHQGCGPTSMSYPVPYVAISEAIAAPLGPPCRAPERLPRYAAASVSITPLVSPPMRPPSPTSLPATYNPSTTPLSTTYAQPPFPSAATTLLATEPTHPPFEDACNLPEPHQSVQEYTLGTQLSPKPQKDRHGPWRPVSDGGEQSQQTVAVGATYPLGSSSSVNIPHPPHSAALPYTDLSFCTPARDRFGIVARKWKNEDEENVNNPIPVPPRKRRRLGQVRGARGPHSDSPLDSGPGRHAMNSERQAGISMADTAGQLPSSTNPGPTSHTLANYSVGSSEQPSSYSYTLPLFPPYRPSALSAFPAVPLVRDARETDTGSISRDSFPHTVSLSTASAPDTQLNADVVSSAEIAWDPSLEVYPGAIMHVTQQARSHGHGRPLCTEENTIAPPLRVQSPLRPFCEGVISNTPRRGVERVPLTEAENSDLADGFKQDESGRTICPFVKCSKRIAHRSDCERHVRSAHLGIRVECCQCLGAPRRGSKKKEHMGSVSRPDGFKRHLQEVCVGKERLQAEQDAIAREKQVSSSDAMHILERRDGRVKLPCLRSSEYKDGEKILPMFKPPKNWLNIEMALSRHGILVRDCPADCCGPETVYQPESTDWVASPLSWRPVGRFPAGDTQLGLSEQGITQ
ncbi:hypothetical protein C8Q73DRAFT_482980 [Cubamyces lactineus]|nr:hypothetical protein C8Q73DRAFT_482980 [Cubamyces lactineus]